MCQLTHVLQHLQGARLTSPVLSASAGGLLKHFILAARKISLTRVDIPTSALHVLITLASCIAKVVLLLYLVAKGK
jgi:hypothetical protein